MELSQHLGALIDKGRIYFQKLEKPPLTKEENGLKQENEQKFSDAIRVLRRVRTGVVESETPQDAQSSLNEAQAFSKLMAKVIIDQTLQDKPTGLEEGFQLELDRLRIKYGHKNGDSGRRLSTSFSVKNFLLPAAEDMLNRVQQLAESLEAPRVKLTRLDLMVVLKNMLEASDLSSSQTDGMFRDDTMVVGIMTGGGVYLEMIREIVERYGDPKINTSLVAVNRDTLTAVYQDRGRSEQIKQVILVDDVIDEGRTMAIARDQAGKLYPNATIYTGLGDDQPGGYQTRCMTHLEGLWYTFADSVEEGRYSEAQQQFAKAKAYADENGVELQPAWNKRKIVIDKHFRTKQIS